MGDPACYEIGKYNIYNRFLMDDVSRCLIYVQDELNWGRGFYEVAQGSACNDRETQTPSVYVEEEGLQAITSGFRRTENANNVDQMIGALYAGLGDSFDVGRYHSLLIPRDAMPAGFLVSAWTHDADAVVMGIRHERWPVFGVQFHPESVLTPTGHRLLQNFLEVT